MMAQFGILLVNACRMRFSVPLDGRTDRYNGAQRLSESSQQLAGVPGPVPRRARCVRQGRHR